MPLPQSFQKRASQGTSITAASIHRQGPHLVKSLPSPSATLSMAFGGRPGLPAGSPCHSVRILGNWKVWGRGLEGNAEGNFRLKMVRK